MVETGATGSAPFPAGVYVSTIVSRAGLMFEADVNVEPFSHEGVGVYRLHITASATAEPGFWWAEGVGFDRNGRRVSVYALTAADLPRPVLDAVELAYAAALSRIPERIVNSA